MRDCLDTLPSPFVCRKYVLMESTSNSMELACREWQFWWDQFWQVCCSVYEICHKINVGILWCWWCIIILHLAQNQSRQVLDAAIFQLDVHAQSVNARPLSLLPHSWITYIDRYQLLFVNSFIASILLRYSLQHIYTGFNWIGHIRFHNNIW